jgi:hypothetical protein
MSASGQKPTRSPRPSMSVFVPEADIPPLRLSFLDRVWLALGIDALEIVGERRRKMHALDDVLDLDLQQDRLLGLTC